MNVKRIEGRLLNFWVAKSAGLRLSDENPAPGKRHDPDSGLWHPHTYNPANDWSHGGAIVAEEWFFIENMLTEWFGPDWAHVPEIADHPLSWFMRAYVAIHFGNEVEDYRPLPLMEHDGSERSSPTSPRWVGRFFRGSWFRKFSW